MYNALRNDISFPAGIMQPPFLDGDVDDAVNDGGVGGVIGHEMGHAFDDQGSRYDANGNLSNWWTAADSAEFVRRARMAVDQYDSYEALPGLRINGRLTLGENIADIGGLALAHSADMTALQRHPVGKIDGFTPEQRFFLSFAQSWRENQREENLRVQINTNSHSPRRFRVNGSVSNLPEFASAFGCRAGDPMVRLDSLRARIW